MEVEVATERFRKPPVGAMLAPPAATELRTKKSPFSPREADADILTERCVFRARGVSAANQAYDSLVLRNVKGN